MKKQDQSEEQLRCLNDNLLNTMLYQLRIEVDGRRQFTYVSEGVRPLHGCSPEQALTDVTCIYGSVYEEDRQRLHDEEELAISSLATFETELRMRRPNGEVGWSQLVSRPRKLEDGAILWDGIEIDITERKAAEQVLAESEERYRRLFEMESDAIVLVDGETGRFIDANPSALKLYGYTRQEFLCLKQEDVSAEPEKTSRATTEGQTYVTNRNHRKKDGTIFPVEISGSYFDSKGRKMRVAAIRDLTAQKQSEELRRKSEAELNRAQAIAHVGSWSWDCRSGLVEWSPEVYRIYGVTPGTFDHTFSSVSKLVHPADLPKLLKAHESHAQGQAFEPYEFRVIRPDGDVSVVQVFSAEIERDATGQPIRVFGAVQDITERQRAESTLRVREEQLRLYAEHSPVAVAMFDRAMNYLMVSRRWLEDYRLGNQSLVGRSHYEVFPEVPQRWRETYQRCLAGAVEKCDEEEFPRADGKTDWIRWEIRPWHQADNSIGGIIIFSEDITQRKRAEQALRHSELRFGSIFQENPVALALSEFETGKFLEVNDTLLRVMKATSRDQMVGRNSIEIGMISETERARLVRLVKTQGRVEQFITEMHRLDGEAFTADLCIGSYEDEGRRFLLTSLVDITERKSAEESHARLATVVEQSSETIVITDTKGTILYANPAFEKSTGYTRAETIGQNPRVLKSGKQGDEFYRAMWETLERGEVWHGHFINRHKNGALYEEDAAISPVRDVAGRIVSYAAVKRDVTREVQLERQLVEAQKMESVGQLAGGVAHDFNNMLAATMMNLSLLQMDKTLKPEARETISELIKEAERAASLTRQLLLFSRRSVMDVKLLDLSDLVTNLLKMLCRLIGEQVVVRFARRAGLPPLEGDAGMIEQVVMNLAVNARDAMPKGGEIDIGIEVVKVNEERLKGQPAVQAGPFLCLSVADSGCGMDEATRQRIFEPFFTTKEPGKGTGLGLATVHGIVAQHKGWVEVESEVGKGTTFKVFLPASTKRRSEAAPVAQPAVKGGKRPFWWWRTRRVCGAWSH